ncbi:GNAT family N-acetyltransferase [Intrasporangium calvum]|nr:GNAT family N-acetyltransferase [Intrasporangium calvum]
MVRRATADDAAAVVELRALMFSAMGAAGVDADEWRQAAVRWFHGEPAQRHTCAVIAERDGQVLAGAMGSLRYEMPSPVNPNGVSGLLSNVATVPEGRRQGLARACVIGVLDWFQHETEASMLELFATGEGAGLYEHLGFAVTSWPAMRMRLLR